MLAFCFRRNTYALLFENAHKIFPYVIKNILKNLPIMIKLE